MPPSSLRATVHLPLTTCHLHHLQQDGVLFDVIYYYLSYIHLRHVSVYIG